MDTKDIKKRLLESAAKRIRMTKNSHTVSQKTDDESFKTISNVEEDTPQNQTDTENFNWLLEEEPDDVKEFIRNTVSITNNSKVTISSSNITSNNIDSPILYADYLENSQLQDKAKTAYIKNGIKTFKEALEVDWHNLQGVGPLRYAELESYVKACAIEIPQCKLTPTYLYSKFSKTCCIEGIFWDPFGVLRRLNKSYNQNLNADIIDIISMSSSVKVTTPIKQLDFISRSDVNKLKKYGLYTLEDLMTVDEKTLLRFQGIGQKRVHSILNGIKEIVVSSNDAGIELFQKQEHMNLHKPQQIVDRWFEEFSSRCSKELPKELFSSWAILALKQKIDDSEFFEECFRQYIMYSEDRDTKNDITSLNRVNLQQWMDSVKPISSRKAIRLKFSGFSLNECSFELGVTRQRVQQIIAREMNCRPAIEEDKYQKLFNKYDFNEQQFIETFNVSSLVYQYLKEACKTPKAVKHDPHLSINDSDIPQEQRKAISDYYENKKILAYGKKIEPTKSALIYEVIKENAIKQTHVKTLFDEYVSILSENGLLNNKNYQISSDRSLLGIIQRTDYAVLSQGELIRYFDADFESINNLISQLNLNDYYEMEISTFLLISKYPQLMVEYDIHDEYELHYLLRKASLQNYPGVSNCSFGRSPMMEIGCKGKRIEQVEAMIKELAPINVKAFAKVYEQRYGVKQLTFIGSWLRQFSSYLNDNKFIWVFDEFTSSEVTYIDEMLTDGYKTIPQLRDHYHGDGQTAFRNRCNAATLRNAGYQVVEQLVFAPETDARQQIQHIFQSDIINLSDMNPLIVKTNLFKMELARLLRSFDLIEVEQNVYTHIEQLECSRHDCSRFYESVVKQISSDYPFTIKSLREHDLVTGINDFPLSDCACSTILAVVPGGDLKHTSVNGTVFFSKTIGAFTFADVLQWIIKYRHVETVSGLQKVLHSDYFCDIQTNVIRFNLAQAGLYKYEWGNLLASTHERQLNFETGLI